MVEPGAEGRVEAYQSMGYPHWYYFDLLGMALAGEGVEMRLVVEQMGDYVMDRSKYRV
jgi:hypothetical protein